MHKYYILAQAKDKKTNKRYFRVAEISSGRQATMCEEQIVEIVRKGELSNAIIDSLNRLRVYNKEIKIENKEINIVEQLNKLIVGSPLKIRINSLNWIQCLYYGSTGSNHYFFDNSGLTGTFALSEQFIRDKNNMVQINLDDNNPTEVAKLLKAYNTL